ncbi:RNA polymerase factor sigma-54 [Fusobacterium sp. PH5-44]|uniref:RNA polymerase factor sigma-54 n=1 Tax=unclassified Fusobacterium TaxID=2648384 RepID=UPI003D20A490
MDFKLELNQELKLILTQEMKMSINILQMPMITLKEFVEKEIELNPAMDIVYPKNNYTKAQIKASENDYSFLDYTYEKENFFQYLEKQLLSYTLDKNLKNLCIYILNNLDHRGYLVLEDRDILNSHKITKEKLKLALDIIHSLEPIGVGAKNLKECLKIQILSKKINDKYLISIIDYFLEELGDKKFEYIAEKLKITTEKVKEYLEIIKKLNPIPARGFDVEVKNNFIIPEGSILVNEVGEIITSINEEAMPKIKLKENYVGNSTIEKNNVNKAVMIIKSIEKRYETLKKILEIIGEKQKEFFIHGRDHMKKLTLGDVANIVGVHPSTVSRSINGKYIYSSQGTIPLKMLFICNSKSIQIKKILENLVKNENRENPISDSIISNKLGIILNEKVPRRTVAKYREELGIGSTRERKIKNVTH